MNSNMLKKLLIFVSCLISTSAFAQDLIQSNFSGYQLSKYYSKYEMLEYADQVDGFFYGDKIEAFNFKFGGIEWKFATMYFYDILEEGKGGFFYQVLFSTPFKSKEICMSSYDDLLTALTKKYGEGMKSDGKDIRSSYWRDGKRSCLLSAALQESKGKEMYWYLTLTYGDIELVLRLAEEAENEL